MKRSGVLFGSLAAALMLAATPAKAAVITGHLGLSGHFIYDTINTSGGAGLDFSTLHTQVAGDPTSSTGPVIEVDAVTTGSYMAALGITPLVTRATILNITNVTPVPDPQYTYAPNGVPILVTNFLNNFDIDGNGIVDSGLHFNLTSFPNVSGPGCPPGGGQVSCAEGPFLLTEVKDVNGNVTGVRIDFTVLGTFVNGADSGLYTGSFGLTINGLTLQEVGNRLTVTGADILCGPGQASDACGFTANFDPIAPIPEPATMLTFGVGSLVLGAVRRRKNAKKA